MTASRASSPLVDGFGRIRVVRTDGTIHTIAAPTSLFAPLPHPSHTTATSAPAPARTAYAS